MEGLCNSRSKSRSNRKTFKDIWDSPFDQMLPYLCDLSSQHLLDMVCLRTEKSNIKKEVEEADFWFFFSDEICSVSSDAQENQSKLKAYCIQFFHARKRKRENAILPIFFFSSHFIFKFSRHGKNFANFANNDDDDYLFPSSSACHLVSSWNRSLFERRMRKNATTSS